MGYIRKTMAIAVAHIAHCVAVIMAIPASILLYMQACMLFVEAKMRGMTEIADELLATVESPIGYIHERISMLSLVEW